MANKLIGRNLLKTITPPKDFDEVIVPAGGVYGTDNSVLAMDVSPERVYNIVRGARTAGRLGDLYQLYRLMETTDARYGGLIDSIKAAVSGMPVKVIVKDGRTEAEKSIAQEYAAIVEESINMMDTHNVVRSFIDAVSYGARIYELVWAKLPLKYGKEIYVVEKVRSIPVSRMRMDVDGNSDYYGQIKIVYDDEPEGYPLDAFPEGKIILVESVEGVGEYDLTGNARRVLGWWLAKIFAQQWWVEYTETYGQPWRVGRYPSGTSSVAKATMRRFLENLGRNAWGLFPETMSLQLIEANRAGTVTTYSDLINMANKEITVATVGQLDTTGDQRQGSYARATVSDGIRHEILQNVAEIVAKGFDEIIHFLLRFNVGEDYDRRLAPRVMPLIVNVSQGKERVETYNAMQTAGIPVPVEQYYLQAGVSSPKVGETVIVNGQLVEFYDFQGNAGGSGNEAGSGQNNRGSESESSGSGGGETDRTDD